MRTGKLSSLVNDGKRSARFQFESWALCVWLTEILLIWQIILHSNGHHSHPGYIYMIPVLHPIPWVGALSIWKRTSTAGSKEEMDSSNEVKATVLLMMLYAYVPLAIIEGVLLALYR